RFRPGKICEQPRNADFPKVAATVRFLEKQRRDPRIENRVPRRRADGIFDDDTAGSDAAERAIDLAEAEDFSVKVATFANLKNPDGTPANFKDAAEAAQADPENVRRVVESAMPAPEFYFAKYLPRDAAGGKSFDSAALATREGLHQLRA